MPVITGKAEYPEDVLDELKALGCNVVSVDALKLAEQVGSSKAVNIVLMGVLAKRFDIDADKWIEALKGTVAQKFFDMNKKAFELGYNL